MTKKLTYEQAMKELKEISSKIEDEQPGVDELTAMISRAKELITFCKERLKKANDELEQSFSEDFEED